MKLKFAILCAFLFASTVFSQEHAFGITAGFSSYKGDIGTKYFFHPKNQKTAFGIIYKWQWTKRIHFRSSATWMKLLFSTFHGTADVRKSYELSFSKDIFELGAGIDFNLFPYDFVGRNIDFHGTPYFIFELVGLYYKKPTSLANSAEPEERNINRTHAVGFALPFGIGYKMRIFNKISLSLEAKIRYMLKDDLDDSNFINRNLIQRSKRLYKTQFSEPYVYDFYTFLGFNFVYIFGDCGCYKK